MEQKRSKKVKSLRAAEGKKSPVNKQLQSSQQAPSMMPGPDRFRNYFGNAPSYSPMTIGRTKRRWICNTNFSGTIVMSDFHNQFLVATSSTTAACYVDCWRLRRFRVYARNNEADYSVQVEITPGNGGSADNNTIVYLPKVHAVESQSGARAAILDWTPSPFSPTGCWHRTSTTNPTGLQLSLSTSSGGGSIDANTLFEAEFEYLVNMVGSLTSYTISSLSGLTVGSLYGASIAGGLLAPLDVNKAF